MHNRGPLSNVIAMDAVSRHLALHGAIILLAGLVFGAPYARAIKRGASEATVHAWRVAHLSLPIGAVLMFSVAALLPHFAGGALLHWTLTGSLIVSGYAFCFALPLGALLGHRGLANDGPWAARLVYAGNLLGALSSLLAAVLLVGICLASL